MLSIDDKISIKVSELKNRYGAKKVIAEFPRKNCSFASVNRLL